MEISSNAKLVSGIVLITVPTIEYGGIFLLGMLRHGDTAYMQNVLRQSLMRAGHGIARLSVESSGSRVTQFTTPFSV